MKRLKCNINPSDLFIGHFRFYLLGCILIENVTFLSASTVMLQAVVEVEHLGMNQLP